MIPLLDKYQLVVPRSLREALDDLAKHPSARPFAGGTDLMVVLEAGHLPEGRYVSLQNCPELLGIQALDGGGIPGHRSLGEGVSIGALTTYTEIQRSARLAREYPLLGVAARETGGVATQNRGTIGGNIANASPAADTPPVLLVYDAELELMSASGIRRVPYHGFHRGYKNMDLAPGEIIGRVILPSRSVWLPPSAFARSASADRRSLGGGWSGGTSDQRGSYYRKVGTRRAQAIAKVCFAGTIRVDNGVVQDTRIALGSVAPTVIRALATEEALRGQQLDSNTIAAAERALLSEIAPIDDIRSTARYRSRVAGNLLREFLSSALSPGPLP
ncbi:MAG TPA: xanthine dehydrogenase family protein subunit M [Vicinamibacterales bacterium]|nr:xanthine dehydrogenase family protein subunit M [Vicinamibacterales bacterium]